MTFNAAKCKFMLISRRRNASYPSMFLNNHPLERVECYKYLGLLLSSNLSWSDHINSTCAKARKLVGLLYRQFSRNASPEIMARLYTSLVRPHLEYGAQVWHPHLAKDTNALENVQKFGLRVCSQQWTTSYQELLELFHLPSLENRRLFMSLSTFFKIIHNLVYFPTMYHPTPLSSSPRFGHNVQFRVPLAHTNSLKFSFLPNITTLWNHLPAHAVNCTTLPTFKHYIAPLFH